MIWELYQLRQHHLENTWKEYLKAHPRLLLQSYKEIFAQVGVIQGFIQGGSFSGFDEPFASN
jgi:hypothetical protein